MKRAPRHRRAGLEIEPQRRAEIGMLLGREREIALVAPAGDFLVVRLVRALRDIVRRDVRQRGEQRCRVLAVACRSSSSSAGRVVLESGNLGLERLGGRAVALAHRRADRLRGLVAAVLRFLHPRCDIAALRIEREQRSRRSFGPAPFQAGVEGFGIFSNGAKIMHGERLMQH